MRFEPDFAGITREELLRRALARDQLTQEGQQKLNEELRNRGLGDAEIEEYKRQKKQEEFTAQTNTEFAKQARSTRRLKSAKALGLFVGVALLLNVALSHLLHFSSDATYLFTKFSLWIALAGWGIRGVIRGSLWG